MTPNTQYYRDYNEYVYQINLSRYIATLPFYRRILARFFDKYKITKQEYDKWFNENIFKNHTPQGGKD